MIKIKICGLTREDDIDYVNQSKPDYVGFILHFPRSRRNISPERAAALRSRLSPDIKVVGVFVDQPIEAVAEAAGIIGLDAIQLHGREDDAYIASLRERLVLPIWKAFKIRTAADLIAAEKSAADEILLDNGYGTGEAFDWSLAAGFTRPFLLAGGLTPDNITEAIHDLRPKLVDISSGVETDGHKDRDKIIAAIRAARQS